MDVIEVSGRRIAFWRAGSGPPVLFLHGGWSDAGSGACRWSRCPTSSTSSPGTRRDAAGRTICPSTSGWPGTPTRSPDSSRRWIWAAPIWSGSPSAAVSPSPCTNAIREADSRAPRPVAEALAAGIPGSELVVIPGVGHCAHLEAPQEFTTELRRFLRSASS